MRVLADARVELQELQDLSPGKYALRISIQHYGELVYVLSRHYLENLQGRHLRRNCAQALDRSHDALNASLFPRSHAVRTPYPPQKQYLSPRGRASPEEDFHHAAAIKSGVQERRDFKMPNVMPRMKADPAMMASAVRGRFSRNCRLSLLRRDAASRTPPRIERVADETRD